MIVRTSKKNNPFVIIDKTGLEDINLTWDAKGILCYVLSKPDDWQVHIQELAKNSADGVTVVRTAIKELIEAGYVVKKQLFNQKNKQIEGMEYIFYEVPQIEKKNTQKTSKKTKKTTKNKNKQPKKNIELIENQTNHITVEKEILETNEVTLTTDKKQKTKNELLWEQYVEFKKSLASPISQKNIEITSKKLQDKGGDDFESWAIEKSIENEYLYFKIPTLYSRYLKETKTDLKSNKNSNKSKTFKLERKYEQHSDPNNNKGAGICESDRIADSTTTTRTTLEQSPTTTDWEDDEI